MKTIIANITSFIGSIDGEHYYCSWNEIDEKPHTSYSQTGRNRLIRVLTSQDEISYLNKKDSGGNYKVGDETERFKSIQDIHEELKTQFINQNIVTYENGDLYSEMLCIIDGVNEGVDYFGNIFVDTPNSFYKNLLPKNKKIIIKCDDCGAIHKLEDVSTEKYLESEQRDWIKFKNDYQLKCCEYPCLVWNVIL